LQGIAKSFLDQVSSWRDGLRPKALEALENTLCSLLSSASAAWISEGLTSDNLKKLELTLSVLKAMKVEGRLPILQKCTEASADWKEEGKIVDLKAAAQLTISSAAEVAALKKAIDGVRQLHAAGHEFDKEICANLNKVRWYCLKHITVLVQAANIDSDDLDMALALVPDMESMFGLEGDLAASKYLLKLFLALKDIRAAESDSFSVKALEAYNFVASAFGEEEVPDYVSTLHRAKTLQESLKGYWASSGEGLKGVLRKSCAEFFLKHIDDLSTHVKGISASAGGGKAGKPWHLKHVAADDIMDFFSKTLDKINCLDLEKLITNLTTETRGVSKSCQPKRQRNTTLSPQIAPSRPKDFSAPPAVMDFRFAL
jgi:hypothetical protein